MNEWISPLAPNKQMVSLGRMSKNLFSQVELENLERLNLQVRILFSIVNDASLIPRLRASGSITVGLKYEGVQQCSTVLTSMLSLYLHITILEFPFEIRTKRAKFIKKYIKIQELSITILAAYAKPMATKALLGLLTLADKTKSTRSASLVFCLNL